MFTIQSGLREPSFSESSCSFCDRYLIGLWIDKELQFRKEIQHVLDGCETTFLDFSTQCLDRLFFKKRQKLNRLNLNCIFFTQYLVLSWTFLHNQPAACFSKDNYGWEIIFLWWSVFQQTLATTDCISKSSYMSRLSSIFGRIMLVFYKTGLETVDTDSKACFLLGDVDNSIIIRPH